MTTYNRTADLSVSACIAHAMTNSDLGSLILRVSRSASRYIETVSKDRIDQAGKEILKNFLAELAPELAVRLFEMDGVSAGTRRSRYYSSMSGTSLRTEFIGFYKSDAYRELADMVSLDGVSAGRTRDIDLGTASAVNGSILVIAMDRIHLPDVDDHLSVLVKTASRIRGVAPGDGAWHPGIAMNMLSLMDRYVVADNSGESLQRTEDHPDVMTLHRERA